MAWRKLFQRTPDNTQPNADPPERAPEATHVPPHLQHIIERRSGTHAALSPEQRKIDGLRRQRQAILFDIEQGQLAASPDNPWTQRIALLTDALAAVNDDLAHAEQIVPGPFAPLPATPVTLDAVATEPDQPAAVSFRIGDVAFAYDEDAEWAERGHQLARMDLVHRAGDAQRLVPLATPADLRQALAAHLADSLFVFATDIRDRALDGQPLPSAPTLADLAPPCPICGGWTDWRGTCQVCARRHASVATLKREEGRLLDERNQEAEDRHKLVEGLPLAQRRLRDVEAELARAGAGAD